MKLRYFKGELFLRLKRFKQYDNQDMKKNGIA